METRITKKLCALTSVLILLLLITLYNVYTQNQLMKNGKQPTVLTTTTTTMTSCPVMTNEAFIRERLEESESIWKDGVTKRHATELEKHSILRRPWDGRSLTLIWDFFQPKFNCPHLVERIGKAGDGGKWVCGLSHLARKAKSPCIVYSYGVSTDTSFGQEILRRTSTCFVRAFDHTVNSDNVRLTKDYPDRSSFDKVGLGAGDGGSLTTLKTQMDKHGDKFIDILKVDVEGAEFKVFEQILTDFKGELPFGQLLLEIHLGQLHAPDLYASFKKWFEALEAAGLRAFHREENMYALYFGSKNPDCFEFSFLNVKADHVLLHG